MSMYFAAMNPHWLFMGCLGISLIGAVVTIIMMMVEQQRWQKQRSPEVFELPLDGFEVVTDTHWWTPRRKFEFVFCFAYVATLPSLLFWYYGTLSPTEIVEQVEITDVVWLIAAILIAVVAGLISRIFWTGASRKEQ